MSMLADLTLGAVEVHETPRSWVFTFPSVVLKLEKAANLGSINFSQIDRHHAACQAAVARNSRLAPGVYLGPVPVHRDHGGRCRFGGQVSDGVTTRTRTFGEIIDWAVEMRRLPDRERADLLLESGRLAVSDIERVAVTLANFHAAANTASEVDAQAAHSAHSLSSRNHSRRIHHALTLVATEPEVCRVEERHFAFLEANRRVLEERVHSGRIRDTHGDLRLEHVYFHGHGPPLILDCADIAEGLQYADVCWDIALLAMDLRSRGRSDLAELLLATYARESDDFALYSIVDFYESDRAYSRAQVCATACRLATTCHARGQLEREARRCFLFALASGRPRPGKPQLTAFGGTMATERRALAEALGRQASAPVVASAHMRNAPGTAGGSSASPERRRGRNAEEGPHGQTREALRRAEVVLRSGRSVIVDAPFLAAEERAGARAMAESVGARFAFVEHRAPVDSGLRRDRGHALDEPHDSFTELASAQHIVIFPGRPVSEGLIRLSQLGFAVPS